MNSHFKRWIEKAILEFDDTFTANMVLEKIVESNGTSPYVGTVSGIGWYLSRLDNVIKIKDGVYRRKQ